jgi:hypothetical protein
MLMAWLAASWTSYSPVIGGVRGALAHEHYRTWRRTVAYALVLPRASRSAVEHCSDDVDPMNVSGRSGGVNNSDGCARGYPVSRATARVTSMRWFDMNGDCSIQPDAPRRRAPCLPPIERIARADDLRSVRHDELPLRTPCFRVMRLRRLGASGSNGRVAQRCPDRCPARALSAPERDVNDGSVIF